MELKTITQSIGLILLITTASCDRDRLQLKPADPRRINSIEIADADEAGLLTQELGLEVRDIRQTRLFYFASSTGQDQKLIELGYHVMSEDPMQINYQLVELSFNNHAPDQKHADELLNNGLQIINKEETYWIVRATLEQLNKIQDLGYKLRIPKKEVRPREVTIAVSVPADVQKINELGVDIYNVESGTQKSDSITIHAGAFDFQIEKMLSMGFSVKRRK